METTDPGQALTLIMEANGWTQRRLGQELGGLTQGWVSSAIAGRRDPGIRRYAAYLGYVGWEVVIRPKREGAVKRREFNENVMKLAAGALAGKAAGSFAGSVNADSPYRDPGYVLSLAQRTSDLREDVGGIPIAQKAWAQTHSIDAVVSEGGRQLHTAASVFSRQAAWVFSDSGRLDLAERRASKAVDLARIGDDFENQAAAHALLSDIYLDMGSPDHAAFHANKGLNLPDISVGVRAPLKAYMGLALAQENWAGSSKRRSQKFIDEAREFSGLSPLDSAWIYGVAGLAFHNVGENGQAFSSFDEAVRLGNALSAPQAYSLANAATIALSVNILDHAAHFMAALSYVVPLVNSTCVDRKVKSVLGESAQWASVREIRQAREMLINAISKTTGMV